CPQSLHLAPSHGNFDFVCSAHSWPERLIENDFLRWNSNYFHGQISFLRGSKIDTTSLGNCPQTSAGSAFICANHPTLVGKKLLRITANSQSQESKWLRRQLGEGFADGILAVLITAKNFTGGIEYSVFEGCFTVAENPRSTGANRGHKDYCVHKNDFVVWLMNYQHRAYCAAGICQSKKTRKSYLSSCFGFSLILEW
ncbi:MAG: hypothetical protein QG574_4937, partial [Cyanobacteriota bacterium erpe_2018_sw_21hr_WHONDRS-SW48-000092_B_bin.40]|nr:hypothetical protein [Cyanobacteriota bacterium erpe_2018_sw_21hr_WHONDRS-SW48-000092_B_bin.40]